MAIVLGDYHNRWFDSLDLPYSELVTLMRHERCIVIFDERNSEWTKDPDYNKKFIEIELDYAAQKCQKQGYIFFSDILEDIGILEHPLWTRVSGWISKIEYEVLVNPNDRAIKIYFFNIGPLPSSSHIADAFVKPCFSNLEISS